MTEPDNPSADVHIPKPNYKWAVVGMLWFICFFNYADRVAISSVFPLLKDDFHFTSTQLGIISSAFAWVYAGAAPFAGWIGDHVSRKGLIIGGLYVWSLITGFTGLCGKFGQFVAVRATEGLGETFYIPASISLISDYHGPATRSRAIGAQQTSIYAGTVFGGALAGWMGAKYGWQSPFIFLGGAGIVLGVVLAKFIREPRRGFSETHSPETRQEEQTERPETATSPYSVLFGAMFGLVLGILVGSVILAFDPGQALRSFGIGASAGITLGIIFSRKLWEMFGAICEKPTALLLLLGFLGTNSVALVFLAWTPTYLHNVFNVPVSRAGFMGQAPIQIGSMAGAMLGGYMADRLRRRMKGGRIFIQGLGALLGIPFLALCGFKPGLTVALVALACFGVAKGIHDSNISAGFFDVVRVKNRARAVGLLNFVGWGAGALWTIGFGMLDDQKVPMGTLIGANAGIYAVVCAVFMYAAFVRAPKDIAV